MKFSVDEHDEQFGERIKLDLPAPEGGTVTRFVTKRWFEQMQAEGKIRPMIRVEILDPVHGCSETYWEIGKDIDAETVEQFKEGDTESIYVVTVYADVHTDEQPEMFVVKKELWETTKKRMDEVSR